MTSPFSNTDHLTDPEREDVRNQLQRILGSKGFDTREQRRQFLIYVVEETLAGREKLLKGVSIAMSVFGRDETFDQQIDPVVRLEARRLRRDLDSYYAGSGRDDPIRITIPKGGYVPSFELLPKLDPVKTVVSEPQETFADEDETVDEQKLNGAHWAYWMMGGVVLLLIAASAILVWLEFGSETQGKEFASTDDETLLALPNGPLISVLPFHHLGNDPERQYITTGITEQITTELARFRDIWVMPLGTMQQYREGTVDPQELGRKFGTNYVLDGNVLVTGDVIRVAARLVDVESARYIWVKTYDADYTPVSIYELQNTITREVVGNLAGKYGVLANNELDQAKRKAPDSIVAYDCVLRYYDYQYTIQLTRFSEVKTCLEKAVTLDPEYAEAWALLANIYMQEVRFRLGPKEQMNDLVATALDAVRRAIKLDPTNPTGHMMLSNLLFSGGDIAGFKESGETAIRLNPNNSIAVGHYGMRLSFLGEWDLGRALLNKAFTLNPVHPQWFGFPEVFYRYDRGEYKLALEELNEMDMPHFLWFHLIRAATLGQLGETGEAELAVDDLLRLVPDFQQDVSNIIKVWQLPDPLVQNVVDGLGKAGLEIGSPISGQ